MNDRGARRRLAAALLAWFTSVGFLNLAQAADTAATAGVDHPEARLAAAIDAMQDGRYAIATETLRKLLKDQPNFRLAQLLYGQALALRSGACIGSPLADDEDPKLRDLLAEYRVRHDSQRALPPPGQVPAMLLKLSDELRHAVVVDLSKGRTYVIENDHGSLRTIRNFYSGIGRSGFGKQSEGDLRTPVGIYRITGWMSDDALPPLYGAGALPLSYSNSWDRALSRTGGGIWLHGVPPETYVRAPRSSEGCVTFANGDLLALRQLVTVGGAISATPVILADSVDWQPAANLAGDRERLTRTIEGWRSRWAALDTEAYLDHYAKDFRTDDGLDKAAFTDYKRKVNAGKRRIEVGVDDLSLFAYPGEPGLVLAQFMQNYRSDNFTSSSRKDQYWRRQPDGQWKIVRELNR